MTSASVHVGRQPIHDVAGALYGYELLFRDHAQAAEARRDDDAATTSTIVAAFGEFGAGGLLGGGRGFVNLTRSFLVGELPVPFEAESAVLEVLETVQPDDEVVAGARRLSEQGYRLALDDFVWTPQAEPLLELADVVKVDVLDCPWPEVLRTLERCRPHGVRFLAEKVEDDEMLQRCLAEGFELFQGYHLGRPETLSAGTLTPAHAQALDLIGRLADADTTAADVEDAVRADPALSYRLLRIANSAASGGNRQVSSVRDAIVLVGLARLRAWLVLIALGRPGGDPAPMTAALARARTCEQVARARDLPRPDVAFTVGLLHGVAESLGLTAAELAGQMPSLAAEPAAALRGDPGPLAAVLAAVLAYEAGTPDPTLTPAYLAGLAWTTATTAPLTE